MCSTIEPSFLGGISKRGISYICGWKGLNVFSNLVVWYVGVLEGYLCLESTMAKALESWVVVKLENLCGFC